MESNEMGSSVILPDLIIPTKVNQRWQYSGIDSLEHCRDKKHFKKYPYSIDYQYNSRGFRDSEWPEIHEDLREAVWCVGDSFTVGIGQPFGHIWPQVLSRRMQRRTINVSMDGASNDWICRRAVQIQSSIAPKLMVVMWSYTHRRESADSRLHDEHRRILSSRTTEKQDLWNWFNSVSRLRSHGKNIIELTIPNFHVPNSFSTSPLQATKTLWDKVKDFSWPECPQTLDEFDSLPDHILNELKDLHNVYSILRAGFLPSVTETPPEVCPDFDSFIHVSELLDWARDHHHFDILTSEWLVDQILQRMKL